MKSHMQTTSSPGQRVTLHRCDDRLRQVAEQAVDLLPLLLTLEPLHDAALRGVRTNVVRHVGAGTEGAAVRRQHDGAHVAVGVGRSQGAGQVGPELRVQRIHLLGPVQRDRCHPFGGIVQQRLVGHAMPPR
jgi:hypothetical protein